MTLTLKLRRSTRKARRIRRAKRARRSTNEQKSGKNLQKKTTKMRKRTWKESRSERSTLTQRLLVAKTMKKKMITTKRMMDLMRTTAKTSSKNTTRNEDTWPLESELKTLQRKTTTSPSNSKNGPRRKKREKSTLPSSSTTNSFSPLQKTHFCGKSKLELALKKNHVYLCSTNSTLSNTRNELSTSFQPAPSTIFPTVSMWKPSRKSMWEMPSRGLRISSRVEFWKCKRTRHPICLSLSKTSSKLSENSGLKYFKDLIKEIGAKL